MKQILLFLFLALSFANQTAQAQAPDFKITLAQAEKGDAIAQYNLGLMYYNSEGVPKDDAKAAYWYTKAAEQGDTSAQFNLGWMCENGVGVPKNAVLAAQWYQKAAEQGLVIAQSNLGLMYVKGEGVLENHVFAYAWWNIAASGGDKEAKKMRNIIKKLMTPAQIAEAQRLSSEWKPGQNIPPAL